MIGLEKLAASLENCRCGRKHGFSVKRIEISEGVTRRMGKILSECGFPKKILLVCDRNTLGASEGVLESLAGENFDVGMTVFEDLKLSDMASAEAVGRDVERTESRAILSVGTGSLNDICRWNAAKLRIPFAILATAPSMDGFASGVAPITVNGFKRTFPAVPPDVIAADTEVLRKSPAELKAAGLGDLLGKYTAYADWVVASALTGEYFCENVAALTLGAVERAAELARAGDFDSKEYAAALMEALVISGLAMQLCGCSRPASGAEHHLAHFWEMQYEIRNLPGIYHGKKVGAAAGIVADMYRGLSRLKSVKEKRRALDTETLSGVYGRLWPEVLRENEPDPLDAVPGGAVEKNWGMIRKVLGAVPSGEEIRALLRRAGGAATAEECGIPEELVTQAKKYARYVRRRITVMRLTDMLDTEDSRG